MNLTLCPRSPDGIHDWTAVTDRPDYTVYHCKHCKQAWTSFKGSSL